jgi:L-threonylcarbamoyladenylate synthase
MPAVIDWRQAAAPSDLARQIATALAAGEVVALPSDVGTVLAAAAARMANPGRPPGLPDDLAVRRLDAYPDAASFFALFASTPAERAMAARLWPGPVGWVHDDSPYPAWVPAHSALTAVITAGPAPLALFEPADGGPLDPAPLADILNLIVTDGPAHAGPLTLIRPNDRRWSIERPGVMTETAIRHALARRIVLLCTGTTCRSPMAEGLFRRRLADRLGCPVDELPARGFAVSSAGIMASTGDAAAAESVEVLREYGVDLSGHRSRHAGAELIAGADDVIVMTRSHLSMVLRYPVLGGAVRLLCGADGDLDDPIGRGPDVYQACARTISQHVDRLITELGVP